MITLVPYCCSVVRNVQLFSSFVSGILGSSNSKSYNMKVLDHAVLYILRKFHIFWLSDLSSLKMWSRVAAVDCLCGCYFQGSLCYLCMLVWVYSLRWWYLNRWCAFGSFLAHMFWSSMKASKRSGGCYSLTCVYFYLHIIITLVKPRWYT